METNLTPEEVNNTSTYFLEGKPGSLAIFEGFGEPIKTLTTIHLKYVELNGSLFSESILKVNTEAITSIVLDKVDITEVIPSIYLPNLKSFTFNEYQHNCSGPSKYIENDGIKSVMFFNKGAEWDWRDIWNLNVDITIGGSSHVIKLNHSRKELHWGFPNLSQVLEGAKDSLERLILHYNNTELQKENPIVKDKFPTKLKYIKIERGTQWEEIEECIFQNKNLEEFEMELNLNLKQCTISKLPVNLKHLTFTSFSHAILNIEMEKLSNLEFVKLDGISFTPHTARNFSEYFDTKRILLTSDMFNSFGSKGLTAEILESILKMKNVEHIFTDNFQEKTDYSEFPILDSILKRVNLSLWGSNTGLILEKSCRDSEWSARRLFYTEDLFMRFRGSYASRFVSGTCEPDHTGQYRIKTNESRYGNSHGSLLHKIDTTNCDKLLNNYFCGEIDYIVFLEILESTPNAMCVQFGRLSISQLVIDPYYVKCDSEFEPRVFIPLDLAWIPSHVKTLVFRGTTYQKSSSTEIGLENLAMSQCILQRNLFANFQKHFSPKQVAFSGIPKREEWSHGKMPSPFTHYKDKDLIETWCENPIGINYELLHSILKAPTVETIVLTDFDHNFEHCTKSEILLFLREAGLGGWEKAFVLQKQNGSKWKGKELTGDMSDILNKAFKGESLGILEFGEPEGQIWRNEQARAQQALMSEILNTIPQTDLLLTGTRYEISENKLNQSAIHDRRGYSKFDPPKELVRFEKFTLPISNTIQLENVILSGPEFSAALENLSDISAITEIIIKNAEVEGDITKISVPNLQKFIFHIKSNQNSPYRKEKLSALYSLLFFVGNDQNLDLERIFQRMTISIKIDDRIILEINPALEKIVIAEWPIANEILNHSFVNSSKILSIGGLFVNMDLDLISDQNQLTSLTLDHTALSWTEIEILLNKTKHLTEFQYEPLQSEKSFRFGPHFPKSIKKLSLSSINFQNVEIPSSPLDLDYLALYNSTNSHFRFSKFFNSIQVFSFGTSTSHCISLLQSAMLTKNAKFIYFDNFKFNGSDFLKMMEVTIWDKELVLRKSKNKWKSVHFLDVDSLNMSNRKRSKFNNSISTAFDTENTNTDKIITSLTTNPTYFTGFPQNETEYLFKSIQLSNIVLNPSLLNSELARINKSCITEINLENVKFLDAFDKPIYFPNLKTFTLHFYPCGELYPSLLTWKNLKPWLFFQNGKFSDLWSLGIDISVGVGLSRILKIQHSNPKAFLSRLENSNEILQNTSGLMGIEILGLESRICNPILGFKSLKILRLVGVDLEWTQLEKTFGKIDSVLEELHYSQNGFQPIKITWNTSFPSLRILSVYAVYFNFGPEFQKINLNSLVMGGCIFNFQNCLSPKMVKFIHIPMCNSPGAGLPLVREVISCPDSEYLYASIMSMSYKSRKNFEMQNAPIASDESDLDKTLTPTALTPCIRCGKNHKIEADKDIETETYLKCLGFIIEPSKFFGSEQLYDVNLVRVNGEWVRGADKWVDVNSRTNSSLVSQLFEI